MRTVVSRGRVQDDTDTRSDTVTSKVRAHFRDSPNSNVSSAKVAQALFVSQACREDGISRTTFGKVRRPVHHRGRRLILRPRTGYLVATAMSSARADLTIRRGAHQGGRYVIATHNVISKEKVF